MKIERRDLLAAAAALAPGALLALAAVLAAALLAATLDAPERESLAVLLAPRVALLPMLWLALAIGLGVLAHRAWQRWAAGPARLAERLQALVAADTAGPRLIESEPDAPAGLRALTEVANQLLQQRAALRADIDAQVRRASREIEQERSRLAALMSELTQSVVVCNLDGRVLLYNRRAQAQFRALAEPAATTPAATGLAPIGIGRSIYAVLDRQVVAHALERLRQRLAAGAAQPSAQFVTDTRGGQLLRVQIAPVRAVAADPTGADAAAIASGPGLGGFVLMLDNITRDFADEQARDQLLHGLTEGSRASLGNLLAAVEMLDVVDGDGGAAIDAEADAATRARFRRIVRDEAHAMSQRLADTAGLAARMQRSRWPLEDMLGSDLAAAAARRIESLYGCPVECGEVDAAIWLRVDSYALLQALAGLAGRLVLEYEVRRLRLRLRPAGPRAHLDLVWIGTPMSTETAVSWETEPVSVGGEASRLTLREVVERHNGEFWFERERVRHEAFFRFLLPLAEAAPEAAAPGAEDSRPEFYDFDLFQAAPASAEWADRRLADLSYTVFDTETTGLDPSGGDEILQIGATRIVGGKLRRSEGYEQLVNPGRDIPAASIPIHGIVPERVAGQPKIGPVLQAFHAYAADTVLVAHNAAFDMRFLQLKEAATGLRFEQPVLDTLLLSAWLHPQQESHALEAIAARLGVPVAGRHTALGDAVVTAEVFLRLLPLLAERGIETLGQAREASQSTWHARLTY